MGNETKNISSTLKEFEAVLKDKAFYWLDEHSIQKLLDEKLRRVNYLNECMHIIPSEITESELIFYEQQLKNAWFINVFDESKSKVYGSDTWYGDRWTRYRFGKNTQFAHPLILFAIQAITLLWDKIVIKTDKKYNGEPLYLIGDAQEYLNQWISALKKYTWDFSKLPQNLLYWAKWNKMTFWNYVLEHNIVWNSLRIERNDFSPVSIDALNYDILPSLNWFIVTCFKKDYVDFLEIKEANDNGQKQLRTQKYYHLWMDNEYIDYERYGVCLDAKLDPNKNFIVGIFKEWENTLCKILRVDQDATLMVSIPDIKQLLWFDDEFDVIVIDTEWNLRKIDAHFNDFEMYTKSTINTLHDEWAWTWTTGQDLKEVLWWCGEYKDMFVSDDFRKAVLIVLRQNDFIRNNVKLVEEVLTRIQHGVLITKKERDNLMSLFDLENDTLKNVSNKIIDKVADMIKRKDSLNNLILTDNDPDSHKVIKNFRMYLQEYAYVVDADRVVDYWVCIDIQKDNKHTIVVKLWDKNNEIATWVTSFRFVWKEWVISTIEWGNDDWKLFVVQIDEKGTVVKKNISSSDWKNQPELDDKWFGIVIDKQYNQILVQLNNESFEEVDGIKWTRIDTFWWWWRYGSWRSNSVVYFDTKVLETEHLQWIVLDPSKTVMFAIQDNNVVCFMEDWDEIKKITIDWKLVSNQFAEKGEIVTSDWKITLYHKVIKQTIVSSKPLNQFNESDTSFWWVDEEGKFLVYDKETMQEKTWWKLQWWGKIESHSNIAATIYWYVCFDAQWNVIVYNVWAYQPLPNEDALSLLWFEENAVIIKTNWWILTINNWKCLRTEYTELTKPYTYNSLPFYGFEKDWKRWIGKVVDGKREEWLPATSKNAVVFKSTSVEVDWKTYNLNSKGDFVELKHEYTSLQWVPWSDTEYCVEKSWKRWFAKLEEWVFEEIWTIEYDEKPEIINWRVVTKKWDNYLFFESNKWFEVDEKSMLTSPYKPYFTLMWQGFIIFEVPGKWFAIVKSQNMREKEMLEEYLFYKNLPQKAWLVNVYKLERIEWWFDFVYNNKLWYTYGHKEIIATIQEIVVLDHEQFLVIWKNSDGDVCLCFVNEWFLYSVYARPKKWYNTCNLVSKYHHQKDEQNRNVYYYKFGWYSDYDVCEYIIVNELPNDPFISFAKIKLLKKDSYLNEDFEFINDKLEFSKKMNSWVAALFLTKKIDDNLERLVPDWYRNKLT
jgi:hypothetical protein